MNTFWFRLPLMFLFFTLSGAVMILSGCETTNVASESSKNIQEQDCSPDSSQDTPECLEREAESHGEYKRQIQGYPY